METPYLFMLVGRKWRFFKQPMNLVDFFAIIPFVLDLVIGGLQVKILPPKHGYSQRESTKYLCVEMWSPTTSILRIWIILHTAPLGELFEAQKMDA